LKLAETKIEKEKKVTTTKKEYEIKHMSICNKNNIFIYYQAVDNYNGVIVKDDNGVIKVGTELHNGGIATKKTKEEILKLGVWWKVIQSLYTQEYYKLPEALKKEKEIELDLEVYLSFINKQQKQDYEKQKIG